MTIAKPVGRAQDAELTARILRAAEESLLKTGFAGLRIEQIAQAAGCAKTAIYRRWASKEELSAAVVLQDADPGAEPNTGSLIEDLVIHQEQSGTRQDYELARERQAVLWSVMFEPTVRPLVMDGYLAARRERGRTIVARAIARGEIPPETDTDVLLDMIAGFAAYRTLVRDQPLSQEVFREAARTVREAPPLRQN